MKKLLSLLLLAGLCFSMVACNEEIPQNDDDEDEDAVVDAEKNPTNNPFSDEKWGEILNKDNFQNVTVLCESSFLSGHEEDEPVQTNLVKVDGEKLSLNGEIDTDPNTLASVRSVFVDLAIELIGDFKQFTLDKETGAFTCDGPLTGTATVNGYTAAITCENVTVTLGKDNTLAKIICKMTQDITAGEMSQQFVLDVTFTYSDYGTTTVE